MIRLDGIGFGYGEEKAVLRGLDFTCARGDRIGIVGANGSGKTTLLHTIMGLLTPEAGSVRLFGEDCRTEADFREARKRVGFVFQDADDQLFCPTVAEDVAFGPRNLGKGSSEAHDILHETLDLLEIGHLEARVTHQLSGGEKRLVALATVLAMKPDVLILDEPTTGLDAHTEERLADILRANVDTYVVVSHDRPFLSRVVDRVVRLEDGRLRSEG